MRGFPCSPLESADFEQARDFAVRGCCIPALPIGAVAGAAIFEEAVAAAGFGAMRSFIAESLSLIVGFATWVVCARVAVERSAERVIIGRARRSMRIVP